MPSDPFADGHYIYMKDLRSLAGMGQPHPLELPEYMAVVRTPIRVEAWKELTARLPDREYVGYITRGLQEGFKIGFDYQWATYRRAKKNMGSAEENRAVVDSYLAKERELGRVVGPFTEKACQGLQINRFGVIPKNNQPGKWRLIVDLSHPRGRSVNDGIDSNRCSLTYASIDEAAEGILARGRGTLLAKLDLESAYRMIPVHPCDRPLLGMKWNGQCFLDTALPFGLRSAPKLFNVFADGLAWIFRSRATEFVIHYLDDYLFEGNPGTDECRQALQQALEICSKLGVPVSMNKLEGPSTCLSFLGILLDTVSMELRLPPEKLERLKAKIKKWRQRRGCTKRQLLSLIGHLQHACRVVRPGRVFLRRMIQLSTVGKKLHHRIRLNKGFRSDLEWWALFLPKWNGVSLMSSVTRQPPSVTFTSDASGGWGCGAFSSEGQWFQCEWSGSWESVHITVKELLPMVVACILWGASWQGTTVLCRSDNMAAVSIINSGRSRDGLAMQLMRSLFFFLARYNIRVFATHIAGKANTAADALSRDNLPLFLHQVPYARPQPTPIPPEVRQLLVSQRPDWTSKGWRRLFTSISRKV